jgi:hypothetical protein
MPAPPTEVRIESPHAEDQFRGAPSAVQEALRRQARTLAGDPQHGTFIAVGRVPKETLRRWQARVGALPNLWKVDLPDGWRALYTIGSDGPLRVVIVIEVVRHKEYDRLLGYK